MRFAIASLALAAFLVGAAGESAGPPCGGRAGQNVRYEDARAMPPGWTPSLQERLKPSDPGPPNPTAAQLGGVFALIFLVFALIALMPDFDGWSAGLPDTDDDDRDERT